MHDAGMPYCLAPRAIQKCHGEGLLNFALDLWHGARHLVSSRCLTNMLGTFTNALYSFVETGTVILMLHVTLDYSHLSLRVCGRVMCDICVRTHVKFE